MSPARRVGTIGGRWAGSKAAPVSRPRLPPVVEISQDFGEVGWWKADRADTITESGGDVSQWDDISPFGNHLTASGSGPTTGANTLNGKNVLTGSGVIGSSVGYPATAFGIDGTTGLTLYMVVTLVDTGDRHNLVNILNAFGINVTLKYDDATEVSPSPATLLLSGGGGGGNVDGQDIPAGSYLIRLTCDAGANTGDLYVGGVGSTSLARGFGATTDAVTGFSFLTNTTTTRLAEAMLFSTDTVANDSDVRDYLASEWSVSP